MYIKDNLIKGDKINHQLHLLQQTNAKYFMKLDVKERFNEKIH